MKKNELLQVIEKLINETIRQIIESDEETWMNTDFIDQDGNVNKETLLLALEKWVDNQKEYEVYNKYKDLLEELKKDDELLGLFIVRSSERMSESFGYKWDARLFWELYGYAIKKIVGIKAQPINIDEFSNAYPPCTPEIVTAQVKCVEGYGWKLDTLRKSESKYLASLLPKIRGNKPKTKKKQIRKAEEKANKFIRVHSMRIHGQNNVYGFRGNSKIVTNQFASYTIKVHY